jgi:hypothetical protein
MSCSLREFVKHEKQWAVTPMVFGVRLIAYVMAAFSAIAGPR